MKNKNGGFILRPRIFWLLESSFSLGLVLLAYVLELVYTLDPCPLCVFQRLFFVIPGLIGLVGIALNPRYIGQVILLGLYNISLFTGIGIALRHIWLMQLPPQQVPACGPSLEYLLSILPVTEVIMGALKGSGNCAKIDYLLFGISLPVWSLLGYLTLVIAGAWFYFKLRHKS